MYVKADFLGLKLLAGFQVKLTVLTGGEDGLDRYLIRIFVVLRSVAVGNVY